MGLMSTRVRQNAASGRKLYHNLTWSLGRSFWFAMLKIAVLKLRKLRSQAIRTFSVLRAYCE